ncbi:MAG: NAD(P)-dependent glycerol-1-phosphate dehydrogenase [Thermoplasmata archaeon]|nr:NAD(P)-dependent glycerol-1-phosphate dehydrogenase [Thermoplasmata archaeon]MCI4338442.1 NAD(P)-dependent glycerol-1-phosphate dehydrogenase [Thermoplasmata archaeon]MCI4341855.1 NAD(P)-dependent glycerol-1-phosphate dehydrogenase [Thermoplasmata archaeon]
MVFPRAVLVGHGVLDELGRLCRGFDFPPVGAIVTGTRTASLAGKRAAEILTDAGFTMSILPAGEATMAEVERVQHEVETCGARFLIAVGGGSKIDITKVAAARGKIPFVSVPTSAAHDGISSPRASIRGTERASSVEAVVPIGVLADTSVIVQAPFRLLASGCADVISNETAVLDWRLAARLRNEEYSSTGATLAEYAAREIAEHAPLIKPNLEESVWIAIRPMIVAGIAMSVAGSSRPCSGSEHLFSHALDRFAEKPSLHGEQCGVGAIMMMYLHGGDWRRLRMSLHTIGAPTTARELGVTPEEVVQALVAAHSVRPDRYTILGDNGLSKDAAERLAGVTGVIG